MQTMFTEPAVFVTKEALATAERPPKFAGKADH
jgi:hypothetical protein